MCGGQAHLGSRAARPGASTALTQPPACAAFRRQQQAEVERHRDLIAISVVHTLNAALCEFHLKNCPQSEQLTRECAKAKAVYEATKAAVRELDVKLSCTDLVVRGDEAGDG